MRKKIIYTRHDGGVSVCHVAPDILRWLGCGGFWGRARRGVLETQIERGIARGVRPDVQRRYVHAMQFGGCTTAEALEIIRDRDCAHLGTAIELWDIDEIPRDRWFRDAWKRSQNGGPIAIDINLARAIQLRKIRQAVEAENKRRADELARFDLAIEPDYPALKSRILKARDEIELRHVWPAEMAA